MRNFSAQTSVVVGFPFGTLNQASSLENARRWAWRFISEAMGNGDWKNISNLTPSEQEVRSRFLSWTVSVWHAESWRAAASTGAFVYVCLNDGKTVVLVPELNDTAELRFGGVTVPYTTKD